jgi:hypothetical protein
MTDMEMVAAKRKLERLYGRYYPLPQSSKKAMAAIQAIRGFSKTFNRKGDIDPDEFMYRWGHATVTDIANFMNEYLISLYMTGANSRSPLFWFFFSYYGLNFPYGFNFEAGLEQESLDAVGSFIERINNGHDYMQALEIETGKAGLVAGDSEWEYKLIREAVKEYNRLWKKDHGEG